MSENPVPSPQALVARMRERIADGAKPSAWDDGSMWVLVDVADLAALCTEVERLTIEVERLRGESQ